MKLELNNVCATESGDYYQVSFHTNSGEDADTDGGPYLLVQCQFEDPDGGYYYVESHDEQYCGHVRVKRAFLTRHGFTIDLRRKQAAQIEVLFNTDQDTFDELRRVLQIMFPNLELDLESKTGAG